MKIIGPVFGILLAIDFFANAYDFKGATCEVWTKENEHILIDKKGDTIKTLTK
jgi:hypothetical protein